MSKLSKKDTGTTIRKGDTRSLNSNQLIAREQTNYSIEKGFTPEAQELACELFKAAKKYNDLDARGKAPKFKAMLRNKINTLISSLEDLNYSVESLPGGEYHVKPNGNLIISIPISSLNH